MAELNGMINHHPTHEDEPESSHSQPQAPERRIAPGPEPAQEEEQELLQAPAQTISEIQLAEDQETVTKQELPQAPAQTTSEIQLAEEQETVISTQRNYPTQDLFANDTRRDFIDISIPLYEASIKGDWNAALVILEGRDHLVKCSITYNCETMLHVATSAQNVNFVKNLVAKMQDTDLEYHNKLTGNTALGLAAITGNIEIAETMVARNPNLLTILTGHDVIPLYMAALHGHRDMVSYLYNQMKNYDCKWTDTHKRWVYVKCVDSDLFGIDNNFNSFADIALQIFQDHPGPALEETQTVLGILAQKPSALNEAKQPIMRRIISSFSLRPAANESEAMILLRKILESIHEKPMDEVNRILRGPATFIGPSQMRVYTSRVLFVAAEKGNTKFIVELIRRYPDLIWKQNDDEVSLFHVAASHRHQDIYNLLYEIGSMKDLIVVQKDKKENNMLHLVAKKVEKSRIQDVSGAAFQMQRELLWYKNKRGQTPHEVFTNTHEKLVSDGEKWMRGTASKCMLVATLIATIVFGVAYTIPGGYDEKLGVPIFRHNVPFLVFVVLDAISLVLSSTSILVFLSILTSCYSQEDFIDSLPKKLMRWPKAGSAKNRIRFQSGPVQQSKSKNRIRFQSDPVPFESGVSKVGPVYSVPVRFQIRFGPNIRSDRFQRTGALFFAVSLRKGCLGGKNGTKGGIYPLENGQKVKKTGLLPLVEQTVKKPRKKNVTVGSGSESVPKNRISNRCGIIRFWTGSSRRNM
ncbi:Ankyrin repeat-containing protein [Artemisia annua]|uniref:Ankyrin repeat-containing protein n=1 Tax=Artemisia annua TaxID=35608 RepID=A0A2U1PE49_ARTAN|nr:Ankyrin repeat-containing protein [Artemisia annua]